MSQLNTIDVFSTRGTLDIDQTAEICNNLLESSSRTGHLLSISRVLFPRVREESSVNIVHYTLWEAILASSKFMCQVDVIVAYFCVFEFVQLNALHSSHLALLVAGLLVVCEAVLIFSNFQRGSSTYDHLQTALTFFLFGFGFTPIIRWILQLLRNIALLEP